MKRWREPTPEQKAAALERAAEVRRKRATLTAALEGGEQTLAAALDLATTDGDIGSRCR
jgi:hypothetical protein